MVFGVRSFPAYEWISAQYFSLSCIDQRGYRLVLCSKTLDMSFTTSRDAEFAILI